MNGVNVVGFESGQTLAPCSANARFFFFAQGSTVLCLHYDSLGVERKFQRHAEDVILIVADTVSDEGMSVGRVVSVDASKEAVVWDSETGEEISRYTSYEDLQTAAWMRNGNLALGKNSALFFSSFASFCCSAAYQGEFKVTVLGTSFCSTPRGRNLLQHGQYSTRYARSHHRQTAKHSL